jgi:membrane protein DedA with SNARE-associated domain
MGVFMTIAMLIANYGYYALFIGTFFEGETVLLAAGFAAHQGLLNLIWVILIAILGSCTGDQLAFLLGRWRGEKLLLQFPFILRRKLTVQRLLERFHVQIIIGIRFFYGLRIAGPIIIGMTNIPFFTFSVLNFLGSIIWATLIASAGYYFGATLDGLSSNLMRIEVIVLALIIFTGCGVWLLISKHKSKSSHKNPK